MLSSSVNIEAFSSFNESEDLADHLFVNLVDVSKQKDLLVVVKKSLLISHGTANVEGGFLSTRAH